MHRFELNPNCSMTGRSALGFYLSLVVASLTVAAVFAAQGYWPVLPFAGLELLVLGLAFRHSLRRGRDRERIEIGDDAVVVEQYHGGRSRCSRFDRGRTRIQLISGPARYSPPSLLIGFGNRWCRVGEFLTAEERAGLGRRLRQVLTGYD